MLYGVLRFFSTRLAPQMVVIRASKNGNPDKVPFLVKCLTIVGTTLALSIFQGDGNAQDVTPEYLVGDSEKTVLTIGFNEWYGAPFSLQEFEKSHPDIALNPAPLPTWDPPFQYPLPDDFATLPSIIPLRIAHFSDDLERMVDEGLIVPLDEFLHEIGVLPDGFSPNVLEGVTYKDKVWAVPYRQVTLILQYNKAIFGHLGIQPSFESWEELFEAAETISKANMYGRPLTGMLFAAADRRLWHIMFMADTVSSPESPMDMASLLKSETFYEAVRLHNEFERRGAIQSRGRDDSGVTERTDTGIGFAWPSCIVSNETYGFLEFPKRLRKSDSPVQEVTTSGDLNAFAVKVGTAAQVESAKKVLKWLMSEETQIRLAKEGLISRSPSQRPFRGTIFLPYRISVRKSAEYREITAATEGYDLLHHVYDSTVFIRRPPKVDWEAMTAAESAIGTSGPPENLRVRIKRAYNAVQQILTQAPVRTSEFDEF